MFAASFAAGVSVAVEPAAVTVAVTLLPAPAARRVNVAVVNDAAFIEVLKLAITGVLTATPVAAFAGETVVTVGATAVVKLQLKAVPSGTPALLVTVAAMVAV